MEEALQKIEVIEKDRLASFKVCIKLDELAEKPEDYEEIEEDDDGNKLGPKNLCEELDLKQNFRCLICNQVPIAPIVQCQDCEVLYCGEQCIPHLKDMIEKEKQNKENDQGE